VLIPAVRDVALETFAVGLEVIRSGAAKQLRHVALRAHRRRRLLQQAGNGGFVRRVAQRALDRRDRAVHHRILREHLRVALEADVGADLRVIAVFAAGVAMARVALVLLVRLVNEGDDLRDTGLRRAVRAPDGAVAFPDEAATDGALGFGTPSKKTFSTWYRFSGVQP